MGIPEIFLSGLCLQFLFKRLTVDILVVMDSCSIGIHCNQTQECPKTTYTKKTGLKKLSELADDERHLFLQRISFVNPVPETTICHHHGADIFTTIHFSSEGML